MPVAGVGVFPSSAYTLEVLATNRTGSEVSEGDVVAFDLTGSDGDVSAYSSSVTDPFSNFIAVASAHVNAGWIFGVVQQTIANDAKGRVLIKGISKVKLQAATSKGINIMPTSGTDTASVATSGKTPLGLTLTSGASGGTVDGIIDGFCVGGGTASLN